MIKLFASVILFSFLLYGCSETTEDKIKEKTEDLKQKTEEVAEDVKEKAEDLYKDMKDSTSDRDSAAGNKNAKYACVLEGAKDSKVSGKLDIIMDGDDINIKGEITGLTPGKHGIHIHEKGSCNQPDFKAAGDHFNPTGKQHGDMGKESHMGDLGNLNADKNGVAKLDVDLDGDYWMLSGKNSIVGKSIVVHEKADDFKTQPSGDSGNRIACGIIEAAR
jgi:Cu-Zn family superoxide dismutase